MKLISILLILTSGCASSPKKNAEFDPSDRFAVFVSGVQSKNDRIAFKELKNGETDSRAKLSFDHSNLNLIAQYKNQQHSVTSVENFTDSSGEKSAFWFASEDGECDEAETFFSIIKKTSVGVLLVDTFRFALHSQGECSMNQKTTCELSGSRSEIHLAEKKVVEKLSNGKAHFLEKTLSGKQCDHVVENLIKKAGFSPN